MATIFSFPAAMTIRRPAIFTGAADSFDDVPAPTRAGGRENGTLCVETLDPMRNFCTYCKPNLCVETRSHDLEERLKCPVNSRQGTKVAAVSVQEERIDDPDRSSGYMRLFEEKDVRSWKAVSDRDRERTSGSAHCP